MFLQGHFARTFLDPQHPVAVEAADLRKGQWVAQGLQQHHQCVGVSADHHGFTCVQDEDPPTQGLLHATVIDLKRKGQGFR